MRRTPTPHLEHVVVHGHRRAYVRAGSGPVVLLLHGLGCDHTTWDAVIDSLARTHTVIAPDLLGHGASDKPRGDYSVAGYANGVRDLLTVLGVDSATVVGHSFGGGVAMQFAYQFPGLTERLVLVGSGGLGPEVSPAIRAITTPGWEHAMGVLTAPGVRQLAGTTMRLLARSGVRGLRDLGEAADVYDSFRDRHARAAIRHVVRAVVDWKGQVITMADRAYLTEAMPICVVWGADDRVIPASHADNARELAPGARIEVVPNAGHFPHKDHPERFAKIVRDFIRTTEPSRHDPERWRRLLLQGAATEPVEAEAGERPLQPVPEAG
ncbi:alpha/beta fold hydrolase [Nocardioides xinjiangensis]|uniref:alpha/beta fold hydrolase n=1 Tax=Nocardioides xinjiangensis TaxID=2817376 RepID=UPI0027DCFCFE|nr:alpha/beta fold hydrolase [Nocardioides sp. SYSU D00778]